MTRLGHQPYPMPVGIMRDKKRPQSKCIRCHTCDGYPCLMYAKADAQVICVDPALEHPNVSLLTDAFVARLETNASGREVTTVRVERNGTRETYSANIVVSSRGAINSAALLLRSASDRNPNGLANGSELVGRNYMCHVNTMFLAVSCDKNETRFNKTFGLNDFYHASQEWEYPMGHISMMRNVDANILRLGAPRSVPGMTLDIMAHHTLPFWMTFRTSWVLLRALFVVLCAPPSPALAQQHTSGPVVTAVDAMGMTVADMDRALDFFSTVLSFDKVSDVEVAGEAYEHLEGVFGLRVRVVRKELDGARPGWARHTVD